MDTPGTLWADTESLSVRIFATADAKDELTCMSCDRPIGGEEHGAGLDNGVVTATHDRCLPKDERIQAREQRPRNRRFSRLRARLRRAPARGTR